MTDNGLAALATALVDHLQAASYIYARAILGPRGVFLPDGLTGEDLRRSDFFDEQAAALAALRAALDMAWGIIANAGGGDWTKETEEWQAAAARWRDEHWGSVSPSGALPALYAALAAAKETP